MLEQLKTRVYEANMLLQKYNLVKFTWGNVSGIDRKSGLIVIKPSGVKYEDLTPESMVVTDLSGTVVEGNLNPSSDLDTHIELYKNFPEILGVVHAHSEYATSASQAKCGIEPLGTTHADVFYGQIPCTRDLTDDEINGQYEKNTGLVIAETFENHDYKSVPGVLVASHGPFSWGSSPEDAVHNMVVLEECAKMNCHTMLINQNVKRINQTILDKHYNRKHGENAYYGQKKGMFDDILKSIYDCECGKKHEVSLEKIVFEKDAFKKAPEIFKQFSKDNQITMVCDDNTYKAAGKALESIFDFSNIIILSSENLHANEKAVSEVLKKMDASTDLLVAVGAGTIHDITRYVAANKNINFISVPTAPSVDGYVSTVAAMTWNGAKKTFPAVAPIAMIADPDIIAAAPKRLIASGVGDLIGKYTSIFDWRIGHILTDEHICNYLISLEEDAIKSVTDNIDKISQGDTEAIKHLFYGLVLSGLAMQMLGNSRPASGCEHHISHFIEMGTLNLKSDAYHGEKVGVGLALACDAYKEYFSGRDSISTKSEDFALPSDEIENVFKDLSPEIFKENETNCLSAVTPEILSSKLDEIKDLVLNLPTGDEVRQILAKVDAPTSLEDIGVSSSFKDDILKYSPFVRSRLTLMRVLSFLEK